MVDNSQNRKMYKVIFDRQNCIGAGSCVVMYPERWKMDNNDNRAVLIGGKEENDGSWMVEFTMKELEKFMASAEVCPVNVIHIIDVETGKKLI